MGSWKAAIADFTAACEHAPADCAYALIWRHMSRVRLGQAGGEELTKHSARARHLQLHRYDLPRSGSPLLSQRFSNAAISAVRASSSGDARSAIRVRP